MYDIKTSIDWTSMEIKAQTALNLGAARIKLPGGRVQAERLIEAEYAQLIRPLIMDIPVDSSRRISDLLRDGELTAAAVDALSRPSHQTPPALSTDMGSMRVSYTVSLRAIGASLLRHSRPSAVRPPLSPVKAPAYTGIIIIASGSLPIHGRNASSLVQPCLFPKIWDTDMNLIYERGMTDPDTGAEGIVTYVPEEAIFRAVPSGMDSALEARAGANPLRIIARKVFGIYPTDPVIDRSDALLILSTEENRRLLREARVVFALAPSVLNAPL
jgi:hypothetical protein